MNMQVPEYQCVCGRSFHSDVSFNRHSLRCPMRRRTRRKACTGCSRSKTRCDQMLPSCGRCTIKSLACEYSHGVWSSSVYEQPQQSLPPSLSSGPPSSQATPTGEDVHVDFSIVSSMFPRTDLQTPLEPALACGSSSTSTGGQHGSGSDCGGATAGPGTATMKLSQTPPTTEQELSTIDTVFGQALEGVSCGQDRLPLIHFSHAGYAQRPGVLSTVASISQLHVMRTVHSEEIVLDMISNEVQQLYSKRLMLNHQDHLAAFQAVILYSAMRIYSISHYVNDLIDTIAMTFTQYFLRESVHCLKPEANVKPADWGNWIYNESTRRNYFALHALNVVSNSRKGFSTTLCQSFPDVPLPCPMHVWEAATPESWAFHHQSWEMYCGEPLRGKDILVWVDGKESSRGDRLQAWLTTMGTFGHSIVACAKAQLSAAVAIRPS